MNSSNLQSLAHLPYSDLVKLREKAEQDIAANNCSCSACQMCLILSLEIIVAATHFIYRQETAILEDHTIELLLLEMEVEFFIGDTGTVYIMPQPE